MFSRFQYSVQNFVRDNRQTLFAAEQKRREREKEREEAAAARSTPVQEEVSNEKRWDGTTLMTLVEDSKEPVLDGAFPEALGSLVVTDTGDILKPHKSLAKQVQKIIRRLREGDDEGEKENDAGCAAGRSGRSEGRRVSTSRRCIEGRGNVVAWIVIVSLHRMALSWIRDRVVGGS